MAGDIQRLPEQAGFPCANCGSVDGWRVLRIVQADEYHATYYLACRCGQKATQRRWHRKKLKYRYVK